MRRKEIRARTIKQDNDATCIGRGNDIKGSVHTQRAKRLASKRLRQICKKEDTGNHCEKE